MSVQAEENVEVEQPEAEEQEAQQTESQETAQEQPVEAEEESITFEGASPTPEEVEQQNAPAWVKELRAQHREQARRLREVEEENARLKAPKPAAELGPKPTLADNEYDEEKYEAALTEWHGRKAAIEKENEKQQAAQQAAQAEWQADVQRFAEQRSSLKVSDYADAEAAVEQALSEAQQAVIVKGSEVPAKLAYALGKNPSELKRLAAIKDPIKFAFAVAKLETKLKTEPRKGVPLPEATVKGASGVTGAMDKKLKELEEKADRTGDRTELVRYKAELKRRKA